MRQADLVFGRGLPHNGKWVENAQPRILISYKFFHINPHVLADTTKHENSMSLNSYAEFHIKKIRWIYGKKNR